MSTGDLNHCIGERFRKERDRLKISRPLLASELKVSGDTIKNWEGGGPIPAGAIVQFSEMGADLIYIMTGKPTPPFTGVAEPVNSALEPITPAKRLGLLVSVLPLDEQAADLMLAVARRMCS